MNHDRRTFLRTVGVGFAGVLTAGCSDSTGGDGDTDSTGTGTDGAEESELDEETTQIIVMEAGGVDIWNEADAGHFYFSWTSGDFDVRVRTTSVGNTHAHAKGGIMVRASMDANAANAMVRRRPPGYISFQWRPEMATQARSLTSDDGRDQREYDGEVDPQWEWQRLEREGDTLRGYVSPDGEDWILLAELGPDDIALPEEIYLGLAGTSHNQAEATEITFRDLEGVEPTDNDDIGGPIVEGSVEVIEPAVVSGVGTTSVSESSATLRADLETTGGADEVDVRFEYREVTESEWSATETQTLSETGEVTAEVSGLTGRRYYDVRAFADDGETELGSSEELFATASASGGGTAEGPESAAHHDLTDGFGEGAAWLDDDTPLVVIDEPSLDQFESALNVNGPRVVVFETSGVIDLDESFVSVTHDQCWIAGQTAPSPGITLVRGQLAIDGNDCVIQHIRARPGDADQSAPWEPNAFETDDGTANNVIDHCTGTWATDETITVGYNTENTTVSNCLIAEPLHDSTHHKGPHGYGSLIGNNAENVALMGNVWAFDTDRNPRLKEGTRSVVVNNLVHHYEDGVWMDPDTEASVEGNVYQRPQTDQPNVFGDGRARVADNLLDSDADNPMVGDGIEQVDSRPLWPDAMTAMSAGETYEHNMANAGARPADRTDHDERILQNIRDGEGGVIDGQDEVGGYPDLPENSESLDPPQSGLRAWLREEARAVEQ